MLLSELAVPQYDGPGCLAPHMIIVSGHRRQNTRSLEPISVHNSGDDKSNKNLKKYSQSNCNKLEHSDSSLESLELEAWKPEDIPVFEKQPTKSNSSAPHRCSTNDDSHGSHQALNDLGVCSGTTSSALSFTPATSFSSPCNKQDRVRSASAFAYPFSSFQRTSLPSLSSSSSTTRDKQTKSVRFGKVQLVLTDTLRWKDNDDDDDATDDYDASLPSRWHYHSEYSVDEYEEKLLQRKQQRRFGVHRLEYEKKKLELLEYKFMTSITRCQLRDFQQSKERLESNDSTTSTTTTTIATTCTTINGSSGNRINHHNDRTAATKHDMIMSPVGLRRWRSAATKRIKTIQHVLGTGTTRTAATTKALSSSSSSSQ